MGVMGALGGQSASIRLSDVSAVVYFEPDDPARRLAGDRFSR